MSDNQAYNDAKEIEDGYRELFFSKPTYPEQEAKSTNEVLPPTKVKKSTSSIAFARKQRKSSVDIGV